MTEYMGLDYCADNRLSEEQAWRGARVIADAIRSQLIEGAPDPEACFVIQDADEILCGVSSQPDLAGPMELRFTDLAGEWQLNRQQHRGIFRTNPTVRQADFSVLSIYHQKTYERIANVVLPMDGTSTQLLRYGISRIAASPSHDAAIAAYPHDAGDVMLYPRQVQAAAWLVREVVEGRTTPVRAYSPKVMAARAQGPGCAKDANYTLSQIPIFTV